MELVVPFDVPRERIKEATAVRSTWLSASVRALGGRGLLDRYLDVLPRHAYAQIAAPVAGAWLPIELALAHYRACEAMNLAPAEQLELGAAAIGVARSTSLRFESRLLREDSEPWAAFIQLKRLWKQGWTGGDVCVAKLGPREAQVEIAGWPCADIAYCRVGMRGLLAALVRPFCGSLHAREVAEQWSTTSVAYGLRWT